MSIEDLLFVRDFLPQGWFPGPDGSFVALTPGPTPPWQQAIWQQALGNNRLFSSPSSTTAAVSTVAAESSSRSVLADVNRAVAEARRITDRNRPEFDCIVCTPRVYAAIRKEAFPPGDPQPVACPTLYGLDLFVFDTAFACRLAARDLQGQGRRPRIFAAEGET